MWYLTDMPLQRDNQAMLKRSDARRTPTLCLLQRESMFAASDHLIALSTHQSRPQEGHLLSGLLDFPLSPLKFFRDAFLANTWIVSRLCLAVNAALIWHWLTAWCLEHKLFGTTDSLSSGQLNVLDRAEIYWTKKWWLLAKYQQCEMNLNGVTGYH